ncbi:MAG: glycosyltransferase, partial [Burkholderiales bacterium]|nr:glycosyltransferase [Burkholderiales bacterium]
PAMLAAHAALAREHGIAGFCFQIDAADTAGAAVALIAAWLEQARDPLPFCLMWCNDPADEAASGGDAAARAPDPVGALFLTHLLALAAHPAYLRIGAAPLVLVERLDCLAAPAAAMAEWRTRARAVPGVELFLAAAQANWQGDPSRHGFDAAVSWPPAGAMLEPLNAVLGAPAGAVAAINNYRRLVVDTVLRTGPPYALLPTVLARWDDTPARAEAGQVLVHATPEAFEYWLRETIERARLRLPPAQRIVFLRAWNDWQHGSYLEADTRYGAQFLQAIPRALRAARSAPPAVPIAWDAGAPAWDAAPAPRVSVVMPAYNHERYIEAALASVRAQTLGEVELIVVDDGSTDGTLALARAFAAAAPRTTTVIAQANAGAPAAINRGIAAARGEFIAILNSDDAYEPARLERLVRRLDETGALLAFSDVTFIDRDGRPADEQMPYVQGLRRHLARLAAQPYPELDIIVVNGAISSGNFVFRRELIERIGGFRALDAVHDWDFLLAASDAGRIAFVPERLYRYRLHDANTFSRSTLKSLFEIEAAFGRFFADIDHHPLRSHPDGGPRLLAALRQSAHAGALPPALAGPRALAYSDWVLAMRATPAQRAAQAEAERAWPRRPLLSVLIATWNSPARWLRRALDSVREQTYGDWECCIADDASPQPEVRAVLEEYARRDPRIRLEFRPQNGHISAATNTALAMAAGEFVVLLDHDDELPPDALHWVAREIVLRPGAELIYSDEDKIDENGMRFDPYFKSDWNPDLLCGQNCVSHLGVFRTASVRALGGFRPGLEGAQDWDLALRVTEGVAAACIRHIPRVLYHWRTIAGSAAAGNAQKSYAGRAQQRALEEHLARLGTRAQVVPAVNNAFWRVQYPLPAPRPLVSFIVCAGAGTADPGAGIARLTASHDFGSTEVIIAGGPPAADIHGARPLPAGETVRLAGSLSAAVAAARGEVFCFVPPGLHGAGAGWLEELVAQASRPGVGAAGPMVLDAGGVIIEGGWIGAGGRGFVPLYAGQPRGHLGMQARARLVQDLSIAGARCVAITRARLAAAGGIGAGAPHGWELADLCLRLVEQGLRNVWTPFAEVVVAAHELLPLPALDGDRGRAWLARWARYIDDDPAYNPNLTLEGPLFLPGLPARGRAADDHATLSPGQG